MFIQSNFEFTTTGTQKQGHENKWNTITGTQVIYTLKETVIVKW